MRRENSAGTPLRLIDLHRLTGFSKPKLIADISGGYLKADKQRDPNTGEIIGEMWLVQFADAQAYLRSLGII